MRVVAESHIFIDVRIERPFLLAGQRIQGDDAPERRADVQRPIDVQRRGLESGRLRMFRLVGVAGAKGPGDFQARDVGAIDFFERRVALAAGISTVRRPVVFVRADDRRCREAKQDYSFHEVIVPICPMEEKRIGTSGIYGVTKKAP